MEDTEEFILREILACVKVSPAAAFDALKTGELFNGYKLVEMRFECPGCHRQYSARVDYDTWQSIASRTRCDHSPECPLAEAVARPPVYYAKEKK